MKINYIKIFVFMLIIFFFPFYILITPVIALSAGSINIYNGIDVSSWQGNIDYNQVKSSGIDIVYIKSSEGSNIVDTYFEQNYSNAKSSGLKIGFYHYLTAMNTSEAINQADFFATTISGKISDCKLAMDFESFNNLDNYEINQISIAFLQELKKQTNKELIIYSDTFNATSTFNSSLSTYPLWVAQYDVSEPTNNGNWSSWTGWQYTDTGEVSGIDNYVDMDKFTEDIFLSDTSSIISPSDTDNINSHSYITITIPYGATLSELAIEYNTTIQRLVELNNIANPNLIYAGNTLVIPTEQNSYNTSSSLLYVVKAGDTLSQIALNYNTNISTLASINNISNINFIYVGQILTIPISYHDTSHSIYIVKSGDTLWGISRKFGISIGKIIMLNRILNPNLIYPGNILRL